MSDLVDFLAESSPFFLVLGVPLVLLWVTLVGLFSLLVVELRFGFGRIGVFWRGVGWVGGFSGAL